MHQAPSKCIKPTAHRLHGSSSMQKMTANASSPQRTAFTPYIPMQKLCANASVTNHPSTGVFSPARGDAEPKPQCIGTPKPSTTIAPKTRCHVSSPRTPHAITHPMHQAPSKCIKPTAHRLHGSSSMQKMTANASSPQRTAFTPYIPMQKLCANASVTNHPSTGVFSPARGDAEPKPQCIGTPKPSPRALEVFTPHRGASRSATLTWHLQWGAQNRRSCAM